jgi:NAD-dependent deacetylase
MSHAVRLVGEHIASARVLAVLTGAGISKESGIPTFRDARDGLWAKYDPEELATREGFRANPKLVWEWYQYRRGMVKQAVPNPGHLALAAIEKLCVDFTLITQNVDGLHQAAGTRNVIELHGNIMRNKCFEENCSVQSWDESTVPPTCSCGSLVRPDVVWFGEPLPAGALEQAYAVTRTARVIMVVGTSGFVQPAASLPSIALEHGAWVVEVNTEPTPLSSRAHLFIEGKSGLILPQIAEYLASILKPPSSY